MHGVRVELALGDALSQVVVDRIQIEQVITNLVKNAMEAVCDVRDGTAADNHPYRARADPGMGVEVAVSDSGPGVPAAELSRLVRALLHNQARRHGPGIVHQPLDCRGRTAVGCWRPPTPTAA